LNLIEANDGIWPKADIDFTAFLLSRAAARDPKQAFTMSALEVHFSYMHETNFSGVSTDGQNK
jgi:hypothetical protein